jgi:hypothetical protein
MDQRWFIYFGALDILGFFRKRSIDTNFLLILFPCAFSAPYPCALPCPCASPPSKRIEGSGAALLLFNSCREEVPPSSCFLWCGEERRGGQQEGENRRGKKHFVEHLQDLFDPLQCQVVFLHIIPSLVA